MILVSLVFLFTYSWQMGALVLLCIPVLFLFIYRNNTRIISAQREVMKGYAASESNFVSTMQGIATIKNSNKQNVFRILNQQIYGIFQEHAYGLGKINIRLGLVSGTISTLIIIAMLSLGVVYVLEEQLQLGELMAILGISSSLLPSIANLALVFIPVNETKVAFDRMFEFVNTEQELTGTMEISEDINKIELCNISFRFAGQKRLLEQVNLNLDKGKIIAVAGESGCGKILFANFFKNFMSQKKERF